MSAYEDDVAEQATDVTEDRPSLLDQVMANTPVMSMGSEALAATVKAEIDIQISTAKSYPRSIRAFKEQARTLATLDEKTAASCFYKLPRGGKTLEGPSVRLAEIVASAWGNLRTVTRIISVDKETLTAQASCHDLETNVASTMEVRRRITDRNGRRYNDDMITVTANAAAAIAYRNSVFKVVPFAHVKPVFDEAKLVSLGKGKTIEQRRADALAYWKKQGVSEERLLHAVECESISDLTVDHLITLVGFHTAIKDGEAKIEDIFPAAPKPGANGDNLESRLKKRAEQVKPEPNGDGKKSESPDEIETLFNDLAKSIAETETVQGLNDFIARAGNDMANLRKMSKELFGKLETIIAGRRKSIA